MTLLYPLGFLALLAIPVLVLIYIIKNRYTEQIIASTYIWTLSERFLKRKVPISRLVGLISLILQILIVIFVSFAILHPMFVSEGAARSYCFILDGSGSMNIVQDGKTRFDIAKDEICTMINDANNGSDYTLIYAGSTTDFIFEGLTDKKMAIQSVKELSVNYITTQSEDALSRAQEVFDDNPSVLTYLLTDKDYQQYKNIEIINVGQEVENYGVTGVAYELSGSQMKVTGTVISYATEKAVKVNLYFDGSESVFASQEVTATKEGADFEFLCNKASFGFFKVAIDENDALALDDDVIVYDVAYQNISDILLVSDSPFFMRAALASAGVAKIDFITVDEYADNTGYGLYIFDSFMPEELPDDGAVWFINPQGTLSGTNFSLQGSDIEPRAAASFSTSTTTTVRTLLSGIVDPTDKTADNTFKLKSYVKCRLTGNFYTLASCDNNPIIFVGSNNYGNREAVFSFDMRDSADFLLSGHLATLVKNLIDYSFPTVINDTTFYCGDYIQVNMVAGCTNIKIETPSGKTAYPQVSSTISEYQLTEVGLYRIVLVMKDRTERILNVFTELSVEERDPVTQGGDFIVAGTPEHNYPDEFIESLLYIVIIIAVLAVADYGLYCYEQYQLR